MAVPFFATDPVVARSIGAYNAGITDENVARMQENAAIEQARLVAQAQQSAMQQQSQQAAQLNALRQQELQQQGFFQNRQLDNQRAQTAAQMAWQQALRESTMGEAAKDRASRETIANTMYGNRNAPSSADIQEVNNRAQAMAGRLNFALKNLKDEQAAAEKLVNDAYDTGMKAWSPIKTNADFVAKRDKDLATAQNSYRTKLQQLLMSVPEDAALDFDQQRMMFVPKVIGVPTTATTTASVPPSNGFFGGTPQVITPTPAPAPVIPIVTQPAQATVRTPLARPEVMITVRTSDGKVRRGPESMWAQLKAQDPGAEIVQATPPPPAEGVPYSSPAGGPAGAMMNMRRFFTQ